MKLTLKFDILIGCLNAAVFSYVLSVFWLESLPTWSRLVHLSVALMLVCLLWVGLRRGLKMRLEPILVLFAVFFLCALFSVYWSTERGAAMVSSIGLLVSILGASLMWVSLWNGVPLRTVGYAAFVGASIQTSTALRQFWEGGAESLLRVEGLTGNANALAVQLSIAAFLILVSLRRSFWPPLIAGFFVAVATVVSGSRKIAFVWFVFALLVLQYVGTQFQSSRFFRIGFLLGLPVLVYGFIAYSDTLLKPIENLYVYERIQSAIQGEEGSANVRGAMLREGLELWRTSPLYGHGISQFRFISSYSVYSHNNYTELLVSFGVIGFIIYYSILLTLLFRAVIGILNHSRYAVILALSVLLLLLWDLALVSFITRLIWLFLGVLGYLSQQQVVTVSTPFPQTPKRPEQVPALSR